MRSPALDGGCCAAQPTARDAGAGDLTALYALPKNNFTMGELAKMPASFQSKVRVEYNGCWMWTGATYNPGYAQYRIPGGDRMTAHKYAYLTLVGSIPDGLECDHMCNRRGCVNPYHIQLLSHADNQRRMHCHIRTALKYMREKVVSVVRRFKGTVRTFPDVVLSDVVASFRSYDALLDQEKPYKAPYQYTKTEKLCRKCDTVKPISEFYRVKDWSATFSDYWYPSARCKSCHVRLAVISARLLRAKKRADNLVILLIPHALLAMGIFKVVICG